MSAVKRWSGYEARVLREALRMSQRVFAEYLGVSPRTVSKWEAGGRDLLPVPDSQGLLDTALRRADPEVGDRFERILGEGIAAPSLPVIVGPGRSNGGPDHDADGSRDVGAEAVAFVPAVNRGTITRTVEFDAVRTLLLDAARDQPTAAVAICGPGGFGKTTLATQACHDHRIRETFPEIYWVETGEQCTPARVAQLISDLCVHLGDVRPGLANPEQAGFHLARVLGDRRALIVIDNVWSAADVSPFLLGGPHSVRLVTTRQVRACPSETRLLRLGPMPTTEIGELLDRGVSGLGRSAVMSLADLCGGWPLLAAVVGSSVGQDIAAGAEPDRAASEAIRALRTLGPQAFDVWDADQRTAAIGYAITSSLRNLDDHVAVGGGSSLRERYLSLSIFPAAVPVPLSVLSHWWHRSYGWSASAVRQFCRVLADRSLIDAYLADQEAIVMHDVFRWYLRRLVDDHWSELHRSFIDAYRSSAGDSWSELDDEHEYVWRELPYHLHEAGLDGELLHLVTDTDYATQKASRLGYETLAADRAVIGKVPQAAKDHPAHREWRVAATLTGTGYLLQGLKSKSDIAATLLAAVMRITGALRTQDLLRRVTSESEQELEVQWAAPGPAASNSGADVGHVGAVTGVAARGQLMVSCGEDGTVRLWDLPTGGQAGIRRGHTGWAVSVAISPDGNTIASGGDDGMIRLWATRTNRPVDVFVAHTRSVRSLAFDSTGGRLVTGAEDGQVCIWDVERRSLLRTIRGIDRPVWSVAVGCSDSLIAIAGGDEVVRLFDMRTGELLDKNSGHTDWVKTVAFASAAPLLISGAGDSTVRTWSVAERRLEPVGKIHAAVAPVRCVAVTPMADLVYAAGQDAIVRAFTPDGLVGEQPMPPGVDWVRAIALTRAGSIVAGCEDGALRMWTEPPGEQRLAVVVDGANTVWSSGFADAGRIALFGRGDGELDIRDTTSSELVRGLSAGHGRVWSLAAGGDYIAAACGDGVVRLWSVHDDAWNLRLNEGEPRTWAVALSPAGDRLAASTGSGTIRLWELPSGRALWDRHAHAGRIRSLAFNHDGRLLISGGGDGAARLWQSSTGEQCGEFTSHGNWVRTVVFDGPSGRVAVGMGSGDIHVRDLNNDTVVASMAGHRGRILMLGFTANRDRLVSGAADGTVRLWSVSQRRQLAEVRIDASLHCAAFDPRSSRVLAGSAAGAVAIAVDLDHANA